VQVIILPIRVWEAGWDRRLPGAREPAGRTCRAPRRFRPFRLGV